MSPVFFHSTKEYGVSSSDCLASFITGFSGIPYARRHLAEAKRCDQKYRWGHRWLCIVESLPIIGGIAALVERVVAVIWMKADSVPTGVVANTEKKVASLPSTPTLLLPSVVSTQAAETRTSVARMPSGNKPSESMMLPENEPFLLPELTKDQRMAGMPENIDLTGNYEWSSRHYSSWFRANAREYHEQGTNWDIDRMKNFFEEGLLRHYLAEVMEEWFDIEYNYLQWSTPDCESAWLTEYEKEKFVSLAKPFHIYIKGLSLREIVDKVLPYAKVVDDMGKRYWKKEMLPERLLQLGALFQRRKVETEELLKEVERLAEGHQVDQAESMMKKMLEKDKETQLFQQIVYHWIRDLSLQMKHFVTSTPIAEIRLEDFQYSCPKFFAHPKYLPLLS